MPPVRWKRVRSDRNQSLATRRPRAHPALGRPGENRAAARCRAMTMRRRRWRCPRPPRRRSWSWPCRPRQPPWRRSTALPRCPRLPPAQERPHRRRRVRRCAPREPPPGHQSATRPCHHDRDPVGGLRGFSSIKVVALGLGSKLETNTCIRIFRWHIASHLAG